MIQRGDHIGNWPMQARQVFLDLDEKKCPCCGSKKRCCIDDSPSSGEGHESAMFVYHLDGDRSNTRHWNLVPLCFRCAQSMEIVELHKPLMFDPDSWLLPHVAGWIESNKDQVQPPVTYNLRKWIRCYTEQQGKPWPCDWAPLPLGHKLQPRFSGFLHPDHWVPSKQSEKSKAKDRTLYTTCHYPHLIPSKEAQNDNGRLKTKSKDGAQLTPPQAA